MIKRAPAVPTDRRPIILLEWSEAALMKKIHVTFQFLWYDLWIGAFYDRDKRILFVCPLPMCVFRFWKS